MTARSTPEPTARVVRRPGRSTLGALLLAAMLAHAQDKEALRPEVGKTLQAAQELVKAGKYKEALSKVSEADAVPNRSPYESFIVERMRGSAAAGAGDHATAIKAFEAVLSSGRLAAAEKPQVIEVIAGSAYRAKDYAKAADWAERYFKEGGRGEQMRGLQVNAHYLAGDFKGVVRDLQQVVHAAETAPPAVDETTLRLLASSYLQLKDDAGYAATLEKLVTYHPKKEYWADLIARVQARPGFSDRLALDVYRLQSATDALATAEQYVEMAELALRFGLPGEAKKVIDAGYASGELGSGPTADRHKRLRELAAKQAAEDAKTLNADVVGRGADALVMTGQALVTIGQVDKGIELIEHGIAKGGLRRPDEASLFLGQAYLGKGDKARAVAAFKAVKGGDGAADLARLWLIRAGRRS